MVDDMTLGRAWPTRVLREQMARGTSTDLVRASAMLLVAIATLGDGSGWTAIQQSGGAGEIFMLPALVVLPATVLATVGGASALLVRRVCALV